MTGCLILSVNFWMLSATNTNVCQYLVGNVIVAMVQSILKGFLRCNFDYQRVG